LPANSLATRSVAGKARFYSYGLLAEMMTKAYLSHSCLFVFIRVHWWFFSSFKAVAMAPFVGGRGIGDYRGFCKEL